MKVKLKSDFIDFYDHWFDNDGVLFERMSRNNLSRREMFNLFKEKGILTPLNGKVSSLKKNLKHDDWLVVYLDEYEHQGNGKILCKVDDALNNYPNCYASQYVETYRAISWRELFVGDYYFILKYEGLDSWRSNVNNVNISIEYNGEKNHSDYRLFDYPIYAIDYVADFNPDTEELEFLAIDLNTSPMIKGTGIEDIISAKDIAFSIKKYILK